MFSMQQMREFLEASNQLPLLANNSPSTIWYSDKPPLLGGIPRKISIPEFMKIYTAKGGEPFEYTETVWFKMNQTSLDDPRKKYENRRAEFERILYFPAQFTDRLIISFINPEVGFGVFANEDIPALSMIGVYSGVFTELKPSLYGCHSSHLGNCMIDAKQKGGMTRFIQHMPISLHHDYQRYRILRGNPEADDFFTPPFSSTLLDEPLLSFSAFVERYKKHPFKSPFMIDSPAGEIASGNVEDEFYIMDRVPLFVFYSCRRIERYEQLGFSYGSEYWLSHGIKPCLFNMQGETIGTGNICQNCGHIALKLLTCANCKQAYYCDAQCQKEDWKEHKKQCNK